MDKLKMKLKQADWWEITYLIIYGAVFTFEFLNTTMFEVKWPPRFAYIFLVSTALYTVAKFIWHNTYTKKEMIWAGIILFAFLMPALLTDYRFLWYTGFLIVGAKDIDFDKILKVYLVIGITIMVAAFGASQYGIIEDLEYIIERSGEVHVRHSYGIVYPTDFAAHIFYLVLAAVVYMRDRLSMWERVWLSLLATGFVYLVANAQTSMLCLIGFAMLCVFERVFHKYMQNIGKILQWTPVVCAGGFVGLAYNYNLKDEWIMNLNKILSGRIEISREAIYKYGIKLFGQFIPEVGNGSVVEIRPDYFFLDDSYVRILLEYGVVLFIVMLVVLVNFVRRATEKNSYLIVWALTCICVHSIMEHHLVNIAYNVMILGLFAKLIYEEQIDRRKNVQKKEQELA